MAKANTGEVNEQLSFHDYKKINPGNCDERRKKSQIWADT